MRVDATIDAAFRLRGGEGVDGSTEADLLTLQSGGLNGTYTDLGDGSGTVNYATGASIAFSEFEDMEADNVAIAVNPLTLSGAILDEGGTLDLSGAFVNIDTLDTHQIVISWGDGSANTVLNLAAGARAFNASHKYLDDNPTGTSSDGYAISVTVTDQDDDTGSRAAAVTVRNVAPAIATIVFSDTQIDEADGVTVTGTFADPALGVATELFTGTAIWSDGVATVLTVNGVAGTFSTSRVFLDDHPATGTPFDLFTVSIGIADDDLGSDTDVSGTLRVDNVAPVIQVFASDATFENKGKEGEPVTVTGSFTDIGVLDTHTATVDWGDGTVAAAALVQGAGSGTIQASHAYAAGGIYTVTLTVTDDDTGTHQATTLAVITGVGLNNGVLYVIGSADDDAAHVHMVGNDTIRVHASFIPEAFRDFAAADVDQLISYLCRGDDKLTIAGNVVTPAIVHGDAGKDQLTGGKGPTVLLGGSGDDMLVGQSGANILIGGRGLDRVVGGPGEDVLIGGRTTFDHNQDAALTTAVALWTDPNASYADRADALAGYLTVIDDGDADKLTGSAGSDLFFAGVGDTATDQKKIELEGAALALMAAPPSVMLAATDAAPLLDWNVPFTVGSAGSAAPAWVNDFVNGLGLSDTERRLNAGLRITLPYVPGSTLVKSVLV